jgi:ABC-type molybdate transport system permease subunit
VRVKAKINSFQEKAKQIKPAATIAGSERGRVIVRIALHLEHPSTIADSSISFGKPIIISRERRVASGILNVT